MLVNLADEDVILIGKTQLFLLSMEDQETFIPGVTILLGEYTQKNRDFYRFQGSQDIENSCPRKDLYI